MPERTNQEPDTANRKNMILLIQLRWIAVAGQILTIILVGHGLNALLPLPAMGCVLAALALLNLTLSAWLRRRRNAVPATALLLALILDVAALTAQLGLSGGAVNPFTSLYLLQITLGAVLLDGWATWVLVALSCAGFLTITLCYRPLVLPGWQMADMFSLHVMGMLICFVLDAALLVVFVTRITRNLRERDAGLAALRQHAAEEDHIVRMGFLATGAAHELGTPLASLSVILGDWKRMPSITGDPDLLQEVEEMQIAVQRCKTILTGVLLSAGEARGEAPIFTTLQAFLSNIAEEWRTRRNPPTLIYTNKITPDRAIIADTALKQIVFNVLDNAFEASPDFVSFTASEADDSIILQVTDKGPGFPPDIIERIGTPYRSTKGRLGGGLGLFLVVNVVRKLGGAVHAENLQKTGAAVTISLPFAALGAKDDDGK